jgi:hypothetical protein
VHEEQFRFDVCQLVDDLCGPLASFPALRITSPWETGTNQGWYKQDSQH